MLRRSQRISSKVKGCLKTFPPFGVAQPKRGWLKPGRRWAPCRALWERGQLGTHLLKTKRRYLCKSKHKVGSLRCETGYKRYTTLKDPHLLSISMKVKQWQYGGKRPIPTQGNSNVVCGVASPVEGLSLSSLKV